MLLSRSDSFNSPQEKIPLRVFGICLGKNDINANYYVARHTAVWTRERIYILLWKLFLYINACVFFSRFISAIFLNNFIPIPNIYNYYACNAYKCSVIHKIEFIICCWCFSICLREGKAGVNVNIWNWKISQAIPYYLPWCTWFIPCLTALWHQLLYHNIYTIIFNTHTWKEFKYKQ